MAWTNQKEFNIDKKVHQYLGQYLILHLLHDPSVFNRIKLNQYLEMLSWDAAESKLSILSEACKPEAWVGFLSIESSPDSSESFIMWFW